MNFPSELILLSCLVLFWLDIMVMVSVLLNQTRLLMQQADRDRHLHELPSLFAAGGRSSSQRAAKLLNNILFLTQNLQLGQEHKAKVFNRKALERFEKIQLRRVQRGSRMDRMDAARQLSALGTEKARLAIELAVLRERHYPTRLYLANALSDMHDRRSIPALVASLHGAHFWYRSKVNMLIASYGMDALLTLRDHMDSENIEIRELLVDLAGVIVSADLRDYLAAIVQKAPMEITRLEKLERSLPERCCFYCEHGRKKTDEMHRHCRFRGIVDNSFRCLRYRTLVTSLAPAASYRRLLANAVTTLEKFFPSILDDPVYLEHPDKIVRDAAIRALGSGSGELNVRRLVAFLGDDASAASARAGLRTLLDRQPRHIPLVARIFESSTGTLRSRLADVLSNRIEYIIGKLGSREANFAAGVLHELISMQRVSELVEFLKHNRDRNIEDRLLGLLESRLTDSEALRRECSLFLPDRLLDRLGLTRIVPPARKREEKLDRKMVRNLVYILIGAIVLFPLLYVLRYYDSFTSMPLLLNLRYFVWNFNRDFAFYALTVNAVYLALMALSALNIRKSARL